MFDGFTVAKILRVLKLSHSAKRALQRFTVAKILRVLKPLRSPDVFLICFTVAKILRVLKLHLLHYSNLCSFTVLGNLKGTKTVLSS